MWDLTRAATERLAENEVCRGRALMWASEKGWLLLNDTETRSTRLTVQVANWAKPAAWGGWGWHHWEMKSHTCLHMSLWTPGRLTHNLLPHSFPWQMEDLQGRKEEGVSAACVRPQMREGARVETGGNICLQQQESSKRGFHQLLFLDCESSSQRGAADRRAGYL